MTKEILIQKRISAISLGCDKNRVDLEYMLGSLKQYGFTITDDIYESEIIIVNTCSFIQPAVKEAINNILLAINLKKSVCEKVIVSGCMVERYINELKAEFPDVDKIINVKDNENIVKIIEELYNIKDIKKEIKQTKRQLTTPFHYAFLKIADGCDNGCSYCTIPRIRGRYKSVPLDLIVNEAKELVKNGVKELIVVAQDITRYGTDLYQKPMLVELLNLLCKIKDLEWIRLHYCYPEMVNEELLRVIASSDKICNYIDIPLQHISDRILKEMNRNIGEEQTISLINTIKQKYPQIAIRSTFIVGFPGETKKDFINLLNFLKQSKLNNVGFFPYYREEKTKAFYMKNQISNFTKKRRLKKVQKLQEQIAIQNNLLRVGTCVKVIVDYFDEASNYYICRDEYNSPEVDFEIRLLGDCNVKIGEFYMVNIKEYKNYIFYGELK